MMKMSKEIVIIVLVILLVISIGVNVYQFTKKEQNVNNIQDEIIKEDSTVNLYEINYEKDNPIDKFFATVYDNINYTTPTGRFITYLYCEAWKKEMDNAYNELYNISNYGIREDILKTNEEHHKFAESQGEIGYYSYSTAFTDDESERLEEILFGTGAIEIEMWIQANIYKEGALNLLENYISHKDNQINFIFNEEYYKNELEKFDL